MRYLVKVYEGTVTGAGEGVTGVGATGVTAVLTVTRSVPHAPPFAQITAFVTPAEIPVTVTELPLNTTDATCGFVFPDIA